MTRPSLLMGRERRKFSLFSVLMSVLLVLVLALFLFEVWFLERFTPIHVDGNSMLNTLEDGDWLYADRTLAPQRGDVVIIDVSGYTTDRKTPLFQDRYGNGISFIVKRVIALGGDEVYGEGSSVYLKKKGEDSFSLLTEPYAYYSPAGRGLSFGPVKLEEGEMYVLGDNRLDSHDSTETGPLFVKDVTGVVPQWAIEGKTWITGWESFRDRFRGA